MKSWKRRVLMVLTGLAMVLAVSIPAIADDVEVTCEVEDGDSCNAHVTVDSYQPEEDGDPAFQGVGDENSFLAEASDSWSPIDDLEWWPW